MSSSNNDYVVYPFSLYLSSLSGRQDITRNPYNHQLTASSPGQMVSAVPSSLVNYMAFNSNNVVNQQGFEFRDVSKEIKKVVKKDRHSKIHTAQGLRDRRVRLSIGIARQFFDLQDMLGFDKASKTLDWLLKKSRKAIKEVVQAKRLNNDDEDSGYNVGNVEEEDDDDDGNKSFVYGSSLEYCEEEEVKKAEKSDMSNISSIVSRAKCKGKETETTREIAYGHPQTVPEISQSEIMDPFKSSILFNEGQDMIHSFYKEAIQGKFDNDQESILTKSKINLPTKMGQSYSQHNGTFIMTDQSSNSNYNTILPQILDYNYDQNPFGDHSYLCIHQHQFP